MLVDERFAAMLEAEVSKDRRRLVVHAVHELAPLTPESRARIDDEIGRLADWLGAEPVLPGTDLDVEE